MDNSALTGGFVNAPQDSARAFRVVMNVLARPGTIAALTGAVPPAPLSVAAGTLALTLLDGTTKVHLAGTFDCPQVRNWITFHTGAPFAGREHCDFAFGSWANLLPLQGYPIGSPEYPDRSATLIVELPGLSASGAALTGPGIKTRSSLSLPDLNLFQSNARHFPLGLDFYFTSGEQIAALPRTTKVEAA